MDLIVIRHGQSEADLLGVHEGRADFSLTELGRRQAEAMAQWVSAAFSIQKIYASPLKRASQTAEYLADATHVGVAYDDDLMEFQNGLLAGLPREEAALRYPVPVVRYPHTALYGQESQIQFRMRAENALSRIIHENTADASVAIISHGGMINMLFRSFLGLPVTSQVSILSGDAGVHHWQVDAPARTILFANRQGQLI